MTVGTLTSRRVEVDLDPVAFNNAIRDLGWGDGLPCIPPTEELVSAYVGAAGRPGDDVVAVLPPLGAECTVEKIAVNAAMTGAPVDSMPLLCAVVDALADRDLMLAGLNATTASVTPAVFVNGPVRDRLDIPYREACFGGKNSAGPSIGRALRLIMRHVAGQVAGVTSESVFGNPARVVGLVAGEWEERSPWAPLAERRGVPGDAVTVFGVMGTMNAGCAGDDGEYILELVGRSAGYVGANGFMKATPFSQVMFAFNPVQAEIVASAGDIDDVRRKLWEEASLPIERFPRINRNDLEELGRVQPDGRVHLVPSPDDVLVIVCGGLGSLHTTILHGFTASLAITRPVPPV